MSSFLYRYNIHLSLQILLMIWYKNSITRGMQSDYVPIHFMLFIWLGVVQHPCFCCYLHIRKSTYMHSTKIYWKLTPMLFVQTEIFVSKVCVIENYESFGASGKIIKIDKITASVGGFHPFNLWRNFLERLYPAISDDHQTLPWE